MKNSIAQWIERGRAGGRAGFTLIELLVVIAIIGILAAIAGPTLNALKPNVTAAATQQLLGDVGRARQLAISERTTVYMVFVPTNFYDPSGAYGRLPQSEKQRADRLLDKQLIGYNFVALRSLGDQPGAATPKYLSSWRTLPEGTFIPLWKFYTPQPLGYTAITNFAAMQTYFIQPFPWTNTIPFPSEMAALAPGAQPYAPVPYIAFNYQGQLLSGRDEIIPLARGSASFGRDPGDRSATKRAPTFIENPPGNSTNSSFNLVYIDKLTGRARAIRQEVQ